LQAVLAASNAGAEVLTPARSIPPLAVGSGKFDTPWERMQRAKFNASCWSPAGLEPDPVLPEALEWVGEPVPHAAITTEAAMVSAVGAGSGRARRGLCMARVGLFIMPSSRDGSRVCLVVDVQTALAGVRSPQCAAASPV
jgi:hypothetical protein